MPSDNSYRNILKGTAIFGGTQFFTILINLVRGKLVALFLGPQGMGISSLITASMNTIQQLSSMGLNLSIVKEISNAKEVNDESKLSLIIAIARFLLKVTACIGAIFTILFSNSLSKITFGNHEYQWFYVLLSVVIFFTTMSNGELSILQGCREIKKLAWASVIGATVGLVIGVPMYYWWGYKGIVPAMIALALTNYVFYKYNSNKLKVHKISFLLKEQYPLIKNMLLLGLTLMIASLIGTFVNYLLNMYIGRYGSLNDVGMYQAANSITNQYVGIIFTAMSLDYFPRLAAVSNDHEKIRDIVNKQIDIVLNIMAPLCCILIIFTPLIIKILLTNEFLPIIDLIRWMSIGLFLKACTFPLGYISFAKGDKKTFFWLEGIWSNALNLTINLISYSIWGLSGMGIALCIIYLISLLTYICTTKFFYLFQITASNYKLIVVLISFILITFSSSFIPQVYTSYICMISSCILCCTLCFKNLNAKMNFIKKRKL